MRSSSHNRQKMPCEDGVRWNAASHQILCSIIHSNVKKQYQTVIARHKIASIRQSKRRTSLRAGIGKPWSLVSYLLIFSFLQRSEAFQQASLNSRIYSRLCLVPQMITLAALVTSRPVKKKIQVIISEVNSHDQEREGEQVNLN